MLAPYQPTLEEARAASRLAQPRSWRISRLSEFRPQSAAKPRLGPCKRARAILAPSNAHGARLVREAQAQAGRGGSPLAAGVHGVHRRDLLRTETPLREKIARVQANLHEEIHKVRAHLLKWTFAFWVGNVAALAGIMFALLRSSGRS